MINVDSIVENSNGDVKVLYTKLLDVFNGDTEAVFNAIDGIINKEEERLKTGLDNVRKGRELEDIAINIEATREDRAYWTQRDHYKSLYHGKDDGKPAPKTKLAKEKQAIIDNNNKEIAIKDYYNTHEKEAKEDNIVID